MGINSRPSQFDLLHRYWRGATNDGITRNTQGFLNEVQSGLPLLNEDTAYTISGDFSRTTTGTVTTRVDRRLAETFL